MLARRSRLPRPAEPASFATLFRSILVAAVAVEGCTDPVPPGAGPPGADPPGENACPTDQTSFSLSSPLDSLRSSARFDYLELKTNAERHWDGGVNPNGAWMTTGASGARCANATLTATCESTFAALASNPASQTRDAWILLYTRGDEVGAIRDVDEFVRLYAPIDTIAEAVFVATRRHTVVVPCLGSVRRLASGGWDVSATSSYCPWGQYAVMNLVVHVAPDGSATTTYGSTTDGGPCGVPGRRPDGLRDAHPDAPDAVGRWLARAAHLEAASVFAFTSLARELADLGAPASLLDAARRSADDERRHARMMGRLAERAGATVPPVEVEAPRARTAFAIALENAVEGCVHETWAAMEALVQSERAARPGVAATMGAIADDEMRHASLAWQVAAWLEPRLTETERTAVCEAREGARAALEANVARGYDPVVAEALGLPSPGLAAHLAASLHAALCCAHPFQNLQTYGLPSA